MKKILAFMFLSFWVTSIFAQTYVIPVDIHVFEIVSKGKSNTPCSGRIWKYIRGSEISFAIQLSSMSDDDDFEYEISTKEQIDKNTIKYYISKDSNLEFGDYYIIEEKDTKEENIYFFEFPALYPSQGRTVYKAVKDELF